MDSNKIVLLVHTLKYLRFKQLYYRIYYLVRNRFFKKEYNKQLREEIETLEWKDSFLYADSYNEEKSFIFLNLSHDFKDEIDWNYAKFGKLWTYNLNYFDFLNQEHITAEVGMDLILDYIKKDAILKDGKEPYPISLRDMNWIKFFSRHAVSNSEVNQTLYNHYQTLFHNLEYHLLGNHLLENGYALLFGAYYFKDEVFYTKAKKILSEELVEQVLNDGGHFELSPMYHQTLLHRLLDCINLIQLNSWKQDNLLSFLKEKSVKMLSWLQKVTYKNGNIPMVNDSTYDIAPTSWKLFAYAKNIGLYWSEAQLSDSGYRMFQKGNYELFADVGNIGPDYQPGHAHSDTFNFELYVNELPVIVDTGISTYEKNALRQEERETASHNTVKIGNFEQTEVWGGFRVAKRAKIIAIKEGEEVLEASHDGYKSLGIIHTRKFIPKKNKIIVEDLISKQTDLTQIALFHFHPTIDEVKIGKEQLQLPNQDVVFHFKGEVTTIEMEEYEYALGFNRKQKAKKVIVYFKTQLITEIEL